MYFPGNQVVSEVSEAPEASEMVSDLTGSGRTCRLLPIRAHIGRINFTYHRRPYLSRKAG